MSRAKNLIEKLDGAVRPNNTEKFKSDWEVACNKTVDRTPSSWRSIIDNPEIKSVRANVGRGHKGE